MPNELPNQDLLSVVNSVRKIDFSITDIHTYRDESYRRMFDYSLFYGYVFIRISCPASLIDPFYTGQKPTTTFLMLRSLQWSAF